MLNAELRRGSRMYTEEMRGLEYMTYNKRLKEPDPLFRLETTSQYSPPSPYNIQASKYAT